MNRMHPSTSSLTREVSDDDIQLDTTEDYDDSDILIRKVAARNVPRSGTRGTAENYRAAPISRSLSDSQDAIRQQLILQSIEGGLSSGYSSPRNDTSDIVPTRLSRPIASKSPVQPAAVIPPAVAPPVPQMQPMLYPGMMPPGYAPTMMSQQPMYPMFMYPPPQQQPFNIDPVWLAQMVDKVVAEKFAPREEAQKTVVQQQQQQQRSPSPPHTHQQASASLAAVSVSVPAVPSPRQSREPVPPARQISLDTEDVAALKQQIIHLKNDFDNERARAEDATQAAEELVLQSSDLQTEKASLKREIDDMRQQMETQFIELKQRLEKELATANAAREAEKHRADTAIHQLRDLESKNLHLQQTIDNEQKEYSQLKNARERAERDAAQAQKKHADCLLEINALKQGELRNALQNAKALETQLANAHRELDGFQKRLSDTEAARSSLSQQLQAMRVDLDELKKRERGLQSELQNLGREAGGLRTTVSSQEHELQQCRPRIKTLENKIYEADSEIRRLRIALGQPGASAQPAPQRPRTPPRARQQHQQQPSVHPEVLSPTYSPTKGGSQHRSSFNLFTGEPIQSQDDQQAPSQPQQRPRTAPQPTYEDSRSQSRSRGYPPTERFEEHEPSRPAHASRALPIDYERSQQKQQQWQQAPPVERYPDESRSLSRSRGYGDPPMPPRAPAPPPPPPPPAMDYQRQETRFEEPPQRNPSRPRYGDPPQQQASGRGGGYDDYEQPSGRYEEPSAPQQRAQSRSRVYGDPPEQQQQQQQQRGPAPSATPDRQQQQRRPFAVDEQPSQDEAVRIQLEAKLLALSMEKQQLESEFSRLPPTAGKSIKMRQQKQDMESRLEFLSKETAKIRTELKRYE